jgi:purine-binding chemotaxis protein CheW
MEYVIFKIADENHAIALDNIKEILVYDQVIITDLFDEQPWISGVINLRGEVIPLVDLRIRFGVEKPTFEEDCVIIVVKTDEDKLIGVIVDNIESVMNFDSSKAIMAPNAGIGVNPAYISGLIRVNNTTMVSLLNIDTILKIEELV